MRTYSTEEVARLAGVSYRQLDHWARQGLVEPAVPASGTGSTRRWAEEQLPLVKLVAKLRGMGADTFIIRAVVDEMAWWGDDQWTGLVYVGVDGAITRELVEPASWVLNLDQLRQSEAVAA